MQRRHGVIQVRSVAGPRRIGGHSGIIIRRGVPDGHRGKLGNFFDKRDCARLLWGDGDQPDDAAAGLVEPLEQLRIRSMEIFGRLCAALGIAEKRPLQVDARHLRAVFRAHKVPDGVHGFRQHRLFQRHGRRTPRCDAMGGVEARQHGHSLRNPVARVRAHGGVGVDIDQAGDDIVPRCVHIRCALHRAQRRDFAVKHNAAVCKSAVHEDPCVFDVCHCAALTFSAQAGWPQLRTAPRGGTSHRAGSERSLRSAPDIRLPARAWPRPE